MTPAFRRSCDILHISWPLHNVSCTDLFCKHSTLFLKQILWLYNLQLVHLTSKLYFYTLNDQSVSCDQSYDQSQSQMKCWWEHRFMNCSRGHQGLSRTWIKLNVVKGHYRQFETRSVSTWGKANAMTTFFKTCKGSCTLHKLMTSLIVASLLIVIRLSEDCCQVNFTVSG